jgi:RNA polymerase sigma-70 factor (ECF subfamily)
MADRSENQLYHDVLAGDDTAFERIYDIYHQRVRLTAWRISHRPDWIDELVNESWCRAFEQRKSFDSTRPFLVWMAGIVLNVYREHCRESPTTLDERDSLHGSPATKTTDLTPEGIASEAELLLGLNECMARLDAKDADIIRRRFLDGQTLRLVAKEVNIAEATLRERDIPRILRDLRRCLESRGLKISEIFPAQSGLDLQ